MSITITKVGNGWVLHRNSDCHPGRDVVVTDNAVYNARLEVLTISEGNRTFVFSLEERA